MADRRSLLTISLLVIVSLAIVASILVLGAAQPSPSPTTSESSAPSLPVAPTLPPNDQPAVTLRDFEFKTEAITSVSASPAQSKLWYAQDAWWAGLYASDADEIHIFRLDWATQTWLDTGTVVDERGDADSDFLWTGEHLYVASASKGTASSHRAKIQRFSFDPETSRYVGDADFPVAINDTGASGIVIDRDTRAGLWVTYVSDGSLWVAHTLSSDAHWAAPYKVPGSGPLVDEDVSSLVPYGPGRIGVMWTDQTAERVLFASHADGDADDAWSPVETVASGVGTNDDQLNLKTFELDGARVVATTIRTTVDPDADRNPLDAQLLVMVRQPDGQWTASEAGRVEDKHNRAILLVDEGRRQMYVVAQTPTGGGIIAIKRAPLDNAHLPDRRRAIRSSRTPMTRRSRTPRPRRRACPSRAAWSSWPRTSRPGATCTVPWISAPPRSRPTSRPRHDPITRRRPWIRPRRCWSTTRSGRGRPASRSTAGRSTPRAGPPSRAGRTTCASSA